MISAPTLVSPRATRASIVRCSVASSVASHRWTSRAGCRDAVFGAPAADAATRSRSIPTMSMKLSNAGSERAESRGSCGLDGVVVDLAGLHVQQPSQVASRLMPSPARVGSVQEFRQALSGIKPPRHTHKKLYRGQRKAMHLLPSLFRKFKAKVNLDVEGRMVKRLKDRIPERTPGRPKDDWDWLKFRTALDCSTSTTFVAEVSATAKARRGSRRAGGQPHSDDGRRRYQRRTGAQRRGCWSGYRCGIERRRARRADLAPLETDLGRLPQLTNQTVSNYFSSNPTKRAIRTA
jgi:hypothetical protein